MQSKKDVVMKKPKDTKGTFSKLMKYIGNYKWILLIVMLLCVVGNVMELLGPGFAGEAINAAAAGKGNVDFNSVFYYARLMLIVYLASSIITIIISVIMMHVSKWIAGNLRRDIFAKLMKMQVAFFDTNSTGDIISRVSYDVDVIGTCISTDIVQILTSIVTVIGSFVMMLVISPMLSIVEVVLIPITIFYSAKMRKITQPRYAKRSEKYGIMNGFVEEMFSGQKTIQAYAYEGKINKKFDFINREAAEGYYNADYYGVTMGPTIGCINNVGLSLIALVGSILYMTSRITLGQISSFVLYSRKFSGPVNEVANIINELYSALAAAERIFAILDDDEEAVDALNAYALENVRGDVKLENVKFGYDEEKIILSNLNLDVKAGNVVAIVGPTGAGKTTIINLLMRFYDVNSGHIYVDGKSIKDLTRSSLRKAYAMVLQETWVFEGTIFENIAYGKPDATKEEVIEVAKAAKIHKFIMRLPKGYDTVITEDGGNISKGQKQLLTIARAMLYDSRMLILDEATSNVDTSTERQIQKAMLNLMKNKTCFVIAHRLSTIQNADVILVLNHGDVVEQGNHNELMKKRGFYYKLYASQFE